MSAPALKKKLISFRDRAWPALGVLLIVPGAGGAFGGGTLEVQRALGADLAVSYATVAHLSGPTVWSVDITTMLRASGNYSLRVSSEDLTHLTIQNISPAPATTTVDKYGVTYVFANTDGGHIDFTLVPSDVGKIAATLQYGMDPPVSFPITILP